MRTVPVARLVGSERFPSLKSKRFHSQSTHTDIGINSELLARLNKPALTLLSDDPYMSETLSFCLKTF